jgi:colicin import membrane protein
MDASGGGPRNEVVEEILAKEGMEITKETKYYYLHREEVLERKRKKRMEDPAYKARCEERAKKKAEKEAAEALKREEKQRKKEERERIAAEKRLEAKRKKEEEREAKRAAILALAEKADSSGDSSASSF